MIIGSSTGVRGQPGYEPRRAPREVGTATAGKHADDHRDPPSNGDRQQARALVEVGPSPSAGPRQAPRHSAPFIAQVAAAHLGSLPDAERRVNRNADVVLPRARTAYRAAARLATEIEPGFLARREV